MSYIVILKKRTNIKYETWNINTENNTLAILISIHPWIYLYIYHHLSIYILFLSSSIYILNTTIAPPHTPFLLFLFFISVSFVHLTQTHTHIYIYIYIYIYTYIHTHTHTYTHAHTKQNEQHACTRTSFPLIYHHPLFHPSPPSFHNHIT